MVDWAGLWWVLVDARCKDRSRLANGRWCVMADRWVRPQTRAHPPAWPPRVAPPTPWVPPTAHLPPPPPPAGLPPDAQCFDTVCTLADLRFDVWHATIDSEGGIGSQLFYCRCVHSSAGPGAGGRQEGPHRACGWVGPGRQASTAWRRARRSRAAASPARAPAGRRAACLPPGAALSRRTLLVRTLHTLAAARAQTSVSLTRSPPRPP